MGRLRFSWLLSLSLLFTLTGYVQGQAGFGRKLPPGTPKHVIFGDLKVEGSEQPGAPKSYLVILKNSAGVIFGRDSIAAGGRFRFLNVPNADYELVVEVNNSEVYRSRFVLSESRSSDLQKDIELIWRKPQQTTSRGIVYARGRSTRGPFEKGQQKVAEGKLKEAAKLFEQVVTEDPKDFEAWTELGTVQFRRKKWDDAERSYREATRARADYLLAWLNLGKLQLDRNQPDQAIESFTKAVTLDPESAEGNHLLGEAYLRMKKGSKAVGFLYEAIRLDPEGKAEVHLRLAQLYNAAGMKDRAANEYKEFLAKRPDWPQRKELEDYIEKHLSP